MAYWSNQALPDWLHDTSSLCDDRRSLPHDGQDSNEPRHMAMTDSSLAESFLITRKDGHCAEYPVQGLSCDDSLKRALATGGPPYDVTAIELSGTGISDLGLANLSGLVELARLELDNTDVSDNGIAQLLRLSLPNLKELNLNSTRVTDVGAALTCELNLHHLRLEDTVITNESVRVLRSSPISILNIGFTRIQDPGLVWLHEMPNLRVLSLAGTNVTDEGLRHLIRCRRLQVLNLEKASLLSDSSIAGLKRKMPGCLIVKPDGMFLK